MRNRVVKVCFVVLGIVLAVGCYFYLNEPHPVISHLKSKPEGMLNTQKIEASELAKNIGASLLQTPLGGSPNSIETKATVYLQNLMKDPNIQTFFNYTLEFFKFKKEAFVAARFVALTAVFDNSPEKYYLMTWTKNEMSQYSKELMTGLEESRDKISVNPYFHNRMLNLVHALEVPAQQKIGFYADTVARPLVVNNQGDLDDSSQIIEVALILAKQSTHDPSDIAPMVVRAMASNTTSAQKSALQARVLNYYPALDYLFH